MARTPVPVRREERRLRRWDPFELLEEMEAEMERFWRRWPCGGWPRLPRRREEGAITWTPSVDVYEKNGELVVKAELPGVKKEDIEVLLEDGDLVIRGERKAEREVKEEDYYRMERLYGSFYRRLPLPDEAQADKIQANYTDGVLEVRIPLQAKQKAEPKRIEIR